MTLAAPVNTLCVTSGALRSGGHVNTPTFRAVAAGTSGDDVGLEFEYAGQSADVRALASKQIRRQIGLKLRATDGCNLVYAMWRLDPRPQLEVSTKINPGSRTHAQCGARGYTKIKASYEVQVPSLVIGDKHWMFAQIYGDELYAWIDGQLVWRGRLPPEAQYVVGPSGVRSDNIAYRILSMWATPGQTSAGVPKCLTDSED